MYKLYYRRPPSHADYRDSAVIISIDAIVRGRRRVLEVVKVYYYYYHYSSVLLFVRAREVESCREGKDYGRGCVQRSVVGPYRRTQSRQRNVSPLSLNTDLSAAGR